LHKIRTSHHSLLLAILKLPE